MGKGNKLSCQKGDKRTKQNHLAGLALEVQETNVQTEARKGKKLRGKLAKIAQWQSRQVEQAQKQLLVEEPKRPTSTTLTKKKRKTKTKGDRQSLGALNQIAIAASIQARTKSKVQNSGEAVFVLRGAGSVRWNGKARTTAAERHEKAVASRAAVVSYIERNFHDGGGGPNKRRPHPRARIADWLSQLKRVKLSSKKSTQTLGEMIAKRMRNELHIVLIRTE